MKHPHDPAAMRESLVSWRRGLVGVLVASIALLQAAQPARSQSEDRLFPFTLPWDDASAGPTDLSGWNQPIVSEADRLHAGTDGHMYRGSERVRLFGFDFASGAFPDRAFADRVAARLAIIALGYAQNTGAGWKRYPDRRIAGPPPEGTNLTLSREWGEPPILAEGVPARITLPATSARVQVWALDGRGQRQTAVEVRLVDGHPVVDIDPAYRTLWYEVAIGE